MERLILLIPASAMAVGLTGAGLAMPLGYPQASVLTVALMAWVGCILLLSSSLPGQGPRTDGCIRVLLTRLGRQPRWRCALAMLLPPWALVPGLWMAVGYHGYFGHRSGFDLGQPVLLGVTGGLTAWAVICTVILIPMAIRGQFSR